MPALIWRRAAAGIAGSSDVPAPPLAPVMEFLPAKDLAACAPVARCWAAKDASAMAWRARTLADFDSVVRHWSPFDKRRGPKMDGGWRAYYIDARRFKIEYEKKLVASLVARGWC